MQKEPQPAEAVEIFYSYSHDSEDEELKDELLKQLAGIERQGVIVSWHDRKITAGREWAGEIDEHINTAGVILLLISPDFMASGYCNDIELKRAMERHVAGEARVIPIIMRPTFWQGALFGNLQMLPTDARPVTSWANRDEALLNVAEGIYKAVIEVASQAALKEGKSQPAANIPRPPVVGFVPRRDEQGRDIVGLLMEELAPAKNQLVALWGPGGVGKSTLAAEFVRATQAIFKGRVAWVSALGHSEFSLATLLDEIATRLGSEDLRRLAPVPKAARVAALVSEAPALVILDNFETVAEEEQTRCLDFLVQNATCPVLITTRAFVDRDDVTNVQLAAMALDEAREFLRRLIERTPKAQNVAHLDRDDLIQKCEANPLIIQWVVRQIVLSKTPQTALDYLAKGEGDAAERVFTRSFNLPQLGDDGRVALLALSLFIPDASREALAAVAGFGDDLRPLHNAVENLSALWLVETTEGNERLFLRGLTRELARSRLSKEPRADELRRAYTDYFLRYVEAHAQPTPDNLNALEAEKDNILGALDVAFGMQNWEGLMQIRRALDYFLQMRGYWDEGIRSGKQAEEAARAAAHDLNVARFMGNVAVFRMHRGEYDEARATHQKAIEIFRTFEDKKNVAVGLHLLGIISQEQGDFEEARRLYNESLEIKKTLGDELSVAFTAHQLGTLAQATGDLAEAERRYEECLEISKRLDDQRGLCGTLHSLGALAHDRGERGKARQFYAESLKIAEELGDLNNKAKIINSLGQLAEEEGDRAEAARLFGEALHIFKKLGSPMADEARGRLAQIEAPPVGRSE